MPRASAERFGDGPSALARYATRFSCAEINSTLYRGHRHDTYRRWAETVPANFRFALKLPRAITHEHRLVDADGLLDAFLAESAPLGPKRDVLLVQLPPSAAYAGDVAAAFFAALRRRYEGRVACEPRHASWFDGEATEMLRRYRVARVAADPPVVAAAAEPGGWEQFTYRRLHGTPVMYRSAYESATLDALAAALRATRAPAWCIFDNTSSGAAAANALDLLGRVAQRAGRADGETHARRRASG